jgi:hypothetical protein
MSHFQKEILIKTQVKNSTKQFFKRVAHSNSDLQSCVCWGDPLLCQVFSKAMFFQEEKMIQEKYVFSCFSGSTCPFPSRLLRSRAVISCAVTSEELRKPSLACPTCFQQLAAQPQNAEWQWPNVVSRNQSNKAAAAPVGEDGSILHPTKTISTHRQS